MGLAAGVSAFGRYREALRRAADWLVQIQDDDGCWRKFASPFAASGDKTYDTHTAWGMLEADRVDPARGYAQAAFANIRWALTRQRENGWFDDCCLSDATRPLTHTLGYTLRGVLEGYRFGRDPALLVSARKTADALMRASKPNGFLPGRLAPDWSAAADWACLTGTAQIAHCWLLLFQETGDLRYRQAASAANEFVRRTMRLDVSPALRGIKGSFPIDGSYSQFEYPNWAAKFLIDALVLERDVMRALPNVALGNAVPA
jgi:hypothetical protein